MTQTQSIKKVTSKELPGTIVALPLEQIAQGIVVDDSYQRDVVDKLVKEIAEAWNAMFAGVLVANERPDGNVVLLDGQQRYTAATLAGVTHAWVLLLNLSTPEEEANTYLHYNRGRVPLTPLNKFKASLRFGAPEAVAINNELAKRGYSFGGTSDLVTIKAVSALESLYRQSGGDGLGKVLDTLADIWPHDEQRFNGDMLLGIQVFLKDHSDSNAFSHKQFIEKLAAYPVVSIRAQGRGNYRDMGGSMAVNVARALRQTYNSGRRSRRI